MDVSTRPRTAPRRALLFALAAVAAVAIAGCGKIAARAEAKRGNSLYRDESYREALAAFQRALELDPSAKVLWRSVGLSAMALHRAGVKSADNDRYADIAVEAFGHHLRDHPDDDRIREYLTTLLVNAERDEEALKLLRARLVANPGDRSIGLAIDNILLRSDRLEEALASAKSRKPKPETATLMAIAVTAWRKAYQDPELNAAARGRVVDTGLEACRVALSVDPASADGMTYTNLLYREKAKLETNPERAADWTKLAEEWYAKALATKQARPGAGTRS
jgi:tetratricopeptide (TPR) repeat protein